VEKFKPVSERILEETTREGVLRFERKKNFQKLLDKMSMKLHQGNSDTLKSMMNLNENMIKFKEIFFFQSDYDK
jgi:hypothetical protein